MLVEGESDESEFLLEGRYFGQAPEVDGKVILANGEARPGSIRRALVTAAADYDLVADLPNLAAVVREQRGSRRRELFGVVLDRAERELLAVLKSPLGEASTLLWYDLGLGTISPGFVAAVHDTCKRRVFRGG